MTKLTKPVRRETSRLIGRRPIIVTLSPCGGQSEALIGLRLKGQRHQYVCRLSDVYRIAATWAASAEVAARRQARKMGIPWRIYRKTIKHDTI